MNSKGKNNPKDNGKHKVTQWDVVRLWIDTAIAAKRSGKRHVIKRSASVDMLRLFANAAKVPENRLARELSAPALAAVDAIWQMTVATQAAATVADNVKRKDWLEPTDRVVEQLDLALALTMRHVGSLVRLRARSSKQTDLLCDAIGNGLHAGDTVRLIERYYSLFPEGDEIKNDPENGFAMFAWEVGQLVDDLDRLVDARSDYLKAAGRWMSAWPVRRFRHNDGKSRFETVADAVELGSRYPLDTSKTASFRPETPMVRYLREVVWRFYCAREYIAAIKSWCSDETQAVREFFRGSEDKDLQPKVVEAVGRSLSLCELRKSNAPDWARVAVVPYIMSRDAREAATCSEPALKTIWNQNGVKSPATFKSRLMPQVVRTLKSLARPG